MPAVDDKSNTQKDPVGASHGVVDSQNEAFFKNPPNNLGLSRAADQDRSADLVGNQNTQVRPSPPCLPSPCPFPPSSSLLVLFRPLVLRLARAPLTRPPFRSQPIAEPQTEEERKRVQELADKLNK